VLQDIIGGLEELGWASAVLLAVFGAVFAIAGKAMLRILTGLGFGGFLAYLVARIVLVLQGGLIAALALSFLAFIIGFFLAWFIVKLALAVVTGMLAGLVLAYFLGLYYNPLLVLLAIVICVGVMYVLAEALISILAALTGLLLFFTGIYALAHSVEIAAASTIALLIILAVIKLKKLV